MYVEISMKVLLTLSMNQEHDRCLVQFYQLYIGLVETHAKSLLFRAKVEHVVFCE